MCLKESSTFQPSWWLLNLSAPHTERAGAVAGTGLARAELSASSKSGRRQHPLRSGHRVAPFGQLAMRVQWEKSHMACLLLLHQLCEGRLRRGWAPHRTSRSYRKIAAAANMRQLRYGRARVHMLEVMAQAPGVA